MAGGHIYLGHRGLHVVHIYVNMNRLPQCWLSDHSSPGLEGTLITVGTVCKHEWTCGRMRSSLWGPVVGFLLVSFIK